MKKFYISLASMFLSIILIIAIFFIICANADSKYTYTYYGALKDKTERLDKIEGKKIVFIGGSSLSFGLKSKEMEEALGRPIVSYGLYASLGTKVMMELAYPSIHEGDIVVVSPEINKETYSTYMNYNNILKCFEGNQLYQRLSLNIQLDLLYRYPSFSIEKMKMDYPIIQEPYTRDSFDSYMDIEDDLRSQNIMPDYYDTSLMIEPKKELFNDEFIHYLNDYNKNIKSLGATLYFGYSPSNRLAFIDKDIEEYNQIIKDKLEFKSLGNVLDYVYNEYYFYDTNFHLNSSGAYLYSKTLAKNLSLLENIELKKDIEELGIPEPLYVKGESVEIDSITYKKINEDYFVEKVDEAFTKESIRIPKEIFGKRVIGVLDYAFSNLENLKEIRLPESIISIGNSCFSNSKKLERVYLDCDKAPLVQNGLLEGASSNLMFYVPKTKINRYTSGYTWMNYLDYLKPYE